eukprot:Sspe_Gene.102498::Locus_77984_Transcript_1_1_Confidence_1.000_Length_1240::g.102498::m.102498
MGQGPGGSESRLVFWYGGTQTDCYDKVPQPPPAVGDVRVATWNVLKDNADYKPKVCGHSYRHDAVVRELKRIDADVVCLNEATYTWVTDLLRRLPQYIAITQASIATPSSKVHRNAVLVRVSFAAPRIFRLSSGRDSIGVPVGGRMLVATHLTAFSWNAAKREAELRDLATALAPLSEVVVLGDLNIHLPHEDRLVEAATPGFVDVWSALRPGEVGYTWDAHTNLLIPHGWLMWENRRMRLDRVLYRGEAQPRSIDIFGDEPAIPTPQALQRYRQQRDSPPPVSSWLWFLLALPLDAVRRFSQMALDSLNIDYRIGGPQPLAERLMPSDHYGLVVVLPPL